MIHRSCPEEGRRASLRAGTANPSTVMSTEIKRTGSTRTARAAHSRGPARAGGVLVRPCALVGPLSDVAELIFPLRCQQQGYRCAARCWCAPGRGGDVRSIGDVLREFPTVQPVQYRLDGTVSIVTTSNTRDRILDALQDILVDAGYSSVTLELVARTAKVSKGGLLYHFPSKGALMVGLMERIRALAEEEFREAVESEEGVVRYFLRTSLPRSRQESELYWAVIAALRSKEDTPPEAAALVKELFDRWGELLHEELTDPVLAETIRLVGDGMYMSSIAGLGRPDADLTAKVVDRLVEAAAEVRRPRRG